MKTVKLSEKIAADVSKKRTAEKERVYREALLKSPIIGNCQVEGGTPISLEFVNDLVTLMKKHKVQVIQSVTWKVPS